MDEYLMRVYITQLIISFFTIIISTISLANSPFIASKMAEIKVNDLSFKSIMRQFYGDILLPAYIADTEDISKIPNIGLDLPKDDGDNEVVAIMLPIITYKNINNETRYLVIIEKVRVNDSGYVSFCPRCEAEADLYSFKQLDNKQYQLVSRSESDINIPSRYGRLDLPLEKISKNIQPLGKNVVGTIFKNSNSSTGSTINWWETIHLLENDYIKHFEIADAGANNSDSYDETSPLHYSYKGTLQIIPNNSEYFPIRIEYLGDKPTEDYEKINHINYSKIFHFNIGKQEYQ